MKRLYYKWLFKKFYKRVQAVEKKYFKRNGSYAAKQCTRLQELMNYLKDELTGKR
ncbi:MAG: hypothetical protein IJ439_03655 [Tyzzerella sp.]|nr:hypothetical protein [Tyzzerella sp.]